MIPPSRVRVPAPTIGHSLAAAGGALAVFVTACLIPDTGIVLSGDQNSNAVKILERAATSVEVDCACDPASSVTCPSDLPPSAWFPNPCPQPLAFNIPHLMDRDEAQYEFCSCPAGEADISPLPGVEIFVNDLDVDDQGDPLDELYAVLLLDPSPEDNPTLSVAYENYLNPNLSLSDFSENYQPIQQPRAKLRRVLIRDTNGDWDLCNGNGYPLDRGWHQMTLIVTDRPWFAAADIEDASAPPIIQRGVPDFTTGATQDQSHFSFFCYDGDATIDGELDPECVDRCEGAGGDG